ncbi:MAG: endopeptidase La [Myxococcales bacterium]|jgi:ATP-dependent Lon protease|nr:endopeptidase La [Myxococcales bacterium]
MSDDKKKQSSASGLPTILGQEDIPSTVPILPLRNSVFFPGGVLPLAVGRQKTIALIKDAVRDEQLIGVITQRRAEEEEPTAESLYPIGTIARIVKLLKMGDDNYSLVVQGLARFKLDELIQEEPYLKAKISPVGEEQATGNVELEALGINLKKLAREVIELTPELPAAAIDLIESITHPGHLADLIASNVDVTIEEKQSILETIDLNDRMQRVLEFLNRKREILKLSSKIDSAVKGEMSKTQREYYLRQQLKAIKEELGELGDDEEELDELQERLKAAGLPAEVEKAAQKEMNRLKTIPAASSEYTVSRTYLDWIADLPWSKTTDDNLDIPNARAVLEADHFGLEKVKKRILEYLAVRKLKNDMKGPILCLVGPPGVGKTSLGQSVARAVGRKFVRLSFGGVRDEAEIRGHRRTYVGALPGRIIQSMKKAGTSNPLMMLDEIDKLGADFRGDPSAALLEVLDPEQNNTFSDHYLDLPFDLSKVLFIATANQLEPVPPPLRDRMEIIELPGYTFDEKTEIARRHLIPKQIREHGISEEQFELTDEGLAKVIIGFTREAGVRTLERHIADLCRAVAVEVASGKTEKHVLDAKSVNDILGAERYWNEVAERTEVSGVATGLAWTSAGGDILFIEATQMPGKGMLTLTGQLGDVMKESCQAALSYVRANGDILGILGNFLEKADLHVHFPAGAVPKDGPSAGVTILTALVSLMTGIRARGDTAMSGEVTLRGQVLPVGGIKEKVLAAHRAGITRLILPERNRKDILEVPEQARNEIEFHFVTQMDDVLRLALERDPFELAAQCAAAAAAAKQSAATAVDNDVQAEAPALS